MTAETLTLTTAPITQAEALASWAVLVPIPKGTKGPAAKGWNTDPAQWLTTPSAARSYLSKHPGAGVGLLHSESQTATLDIDHEGAAAALTAVGIDLKALIAANPYRVNGRRPDKPVYRVPDGLKLSRKALTWPDPSGKLGPGGRPAPLTIFELRGGPVQDVMPPSFHPFTGQPYTWAGPVPGRLEDLPELPPELLGLWERWAALEPVMKAACPWAKSEEPAPRERDLERLGGAAVGDGESVVDTFNTSRSLPEVLAMFGYKGPKRGPWLAPNSSSGVPGVRLRPEPTPRGAAVVMSWHASDPLGDGLPRDAFAVWALLGEGVDLYTATPEQRRAVVKAAARFLGLPEPQRGSASSSKTSTHSAANLPAPDWGTVKPLPPFTDPVPSLPPEMLPQSLASWLVDEARASGLPLEMVAAPVLAGAGGLIGRRLLLRNAPNAPAVPPNHWAAVCAQPGARKSHAVKLGAAPLERAERLEFERLAAQRSELETRLSKAEAHLDALEGQLARAYKGGKEAQMPSDDDLSAARDELREAQAAMKPQRYAVSDSTIEKLGMLLGDNPQGLTLIRDELTAWLGSFDKAGRESDRAQWLELANGDAVLRVDRMSRETLVIHGACVGVLGSIQPGPLGKILDEQSGAGDGLLQRFQLFIWPDHFPDFDQMGQRLAVDAASKARAAEVLDTLPSLDASELGSTYPSGDPKPLTYTPAAQAIYDSWEVEHEAAKRQAGISEAYRSHLSKQSGTFARLALTFHALEVASVGVKQHPHPAYVGEEAATLAALWCEYLTAHAKKLWREGRRLEVLDAYEVLRFIERGSVRDGQKVTEARAALAQGKAGMTGPRLEAALALLESCGAVRVEVNKPATGRPSKLLRVHPDALEALEVGSASAGAGES